MDEIDKRLRETADRCIKAYDGWSKAKKDISAREELMEAVHELRKVASRVEIEVAVSERDEMAMRPLPIPPHRASRGKVGGELPGFITEESDNGEQAADTPQPKRRPPFRGPRQSGPAQGQPADDDNSGNS